MPIYNNSLGILARFFDNIKSFSGYFAFSMTIM